MSIELIVPTLGESITEATVSKWLKKVGDSFEADEPLVEIETDKITIEVPAPSAGSISEIKVKEGADVNIGGVLALLGDDKKSNKNCYVPRNFNSYTIMDRFILWTRRFTNRVDICFSDKYWFLLVLR